MMFWLVVARGRSWWLVVARVLFWNRQKSRKLAKEEVPGAGYFKKILDFWMNHKSGQLFVQFIKSGCLDVQGWIGMYILMVLSFSTKFIKNSHQNLPVYGSTQRRTFRNILYNELEMYQD